MEPPDEELYEIDNPASTEVPIIDTSMQNRRNRYKWNPEFMFRPVKKIRYLNG